MNAQARTLFDPPESFTPVTSRFIVILMTVFLLMGFSSATYAMLEPEAVVEIASSKLLSQLELHKESLKNDKQLLKGMIEDSLLPIIDEEAFAKRVLGKGWKKATPEERTLFVKGLRKLLIKSYAGAFSVIDGHKIGFGSTRYNKKKSKAMVRAIISKEGSTNILVDFKMLKRKGAEDWRISDVVIEGISLAKSFNSQFRDQIKRQGLSETIASLN